MEYKIERQKGSVKFVFTVPNAEWDEEINAAYIKTKAKYNIPGFRKGKAPRKFIENMYGPTVFFDEAFNTCASKAYGKALSENEDIYPVDEPKVDIENFGADAMVFGISVTVKPEVTLGQYKGLTVKKAEYPVTDKDVEEDIERSLKAKSRLVDITDRAAKNGDTVNIDYSGSVDGVKFNGGTAEKQELTLGSKSFIPGFEEQVEGMKIGEEKDLKVKFPDDYHAEDLKGKDAVFAVKLNSIKFREIPELNDDFVKDTTKFETVAEYRADVKKRLTDSAERRADNENKNNMIDAIVANASVDIPDCMIESELDYMLQDFEYRLGYMYGGMKLDDYFKYTGSSREDFRKDRKSEAEKAVKTRLVMETIIKTEKVEPTEQEIDKRIAEIAEQQGKTLEEYKPSVSEHQLTHIKSDVTVEKTLNELVKANEFKAEAKKSEAKKETKEGAEKKPAAAKSATAKTTSAKTATAKKPAAKKE
ncbi:trigger factor [Pumilibacter intestinalis]|uniref:trigger factor n=1 Tax=Pumilibacter intestinalis TaxID=2941511 RepID=UPI00203FBF2B|nr:trigger factor [Pumilibacter intestinalis]